MSLTAELKSFARSLGFHLIGVTSPAPFEQAQLDITRWLSEGHQGEMGWLNEARTRLATHPDELLPDARSLVVVAVSYRTEEPPPGEPLRGRVARYAWGGDYHDVMKQRLRELSEFLTRRVEHPVRSRAFVDSGPLVERDAAVRAGLGFRGKNTNLLTPIGSYVFLGALLTDVALEFDEPLAKDCGSCRLCLDACPTSALDEPYHLAAERCIAYLTIEHRGPIDEELRPLMGDWVFGCDICQEVCPYNASTRARPRGWAEFEPRPGIGTSLELPALLSIDDEGFRQTFRGSPIKRAKRRGLARNAAIALANSDSPDADDLVRAAAQHDEPLVREAAEWAVSRLH
ncbi:MAG: tRNA epoxyqueuosine(34) reductase QueG [Chloroflexi bacterium]|nr:tRNA epoxyqueuosine(34) reductase QueG [Chloroflexota bacterium]